MSKEFKCLHSGKCCEMVYTQISLTFGDLIRIAKFLDWPIKKLFEKKIVGLKPFNVSENVFEYELGLTVPCKFRINKRCKIYSARPLNCRLFPYWLLAEASEQKIKEKIDVGYECVHRTELDDEMRQRYRNYKNKIVEILNKEAEQTERFLKENKLVFSVDISKQKGFDKIIKQVKELEKKFSGVELGKKQDGVKIKFAISVLDKVRCKHFAEAIICGIKCPEIEESSATLDDLELVEQFKA